MRKLAAGLVLIVLAAPAWAASLGTASRSVIPAQVQQIISVDYRKVGASASALALKERALPQELKQFETTLRKVGIDPDRDLDQLTFASFRVPEKGTRLLGIAQGQFALKQVQQRMRRQKITPQKYRATDIYPMGEAVRMALLDDSTMVFGELSAVHTALDTFFGEGESLNSNPQVADMMTAVESGALWSVLDPAGTQFMLRSSLGEAARLADFETVKKRLQGSRYRMDFDSGIDFDLDIITSDNFTAATLSSLIQAGVLYRKMNSSGADKEILDELKVSSDGGNVRMRFHTDDKRFQALIQSDLFAAAVRR
ncbi:MAG TPA: hypothetical protein VNK82_06050 [Terriglobales bacterium]|nr:hypothetical protein [Terriglobales bacterium]